MYFFKEREWDYLNHFIWHHVYTWNNKSYAGPAALTRSEEMTWRGIMNNGHGEIRNVDLHFPQSLIVCHGCETNSMKQSSLAAIKNINAAADSAAQHELQPELFTHNQENE